MRARCPLLAEAASIIGDIQVRNMGTIGGSVAHADPAADYPASLLALEAKVVLASAKGKRELPISDFFVDTFTTALEPGEIVQEVIVPVEDQAVGTSYQKMLQPASGFAIVGVAARIRKSGGKIALARVGVTGLSGKPYRASAVEKALEGTAGSPSDIQKAAALVADGVDANSDLHRFGGLSQASGSHLHNARAHRCPFEDGLKISGSYAVPAPRERAYQLLQDPAILAKCMPGTDQLNKIADDEYEMKMKVVIASIGGSFGGKIRLADQHPARKLQTDGGGQRQNRILKRRRTVELASAR